MIPSKKERLDSFLQWVRSLLPFLILIFAVTYILCTWKYYWVESAMNPLPQASVQNALFSSPKIIFMLQTTLFYLIPICAVTFVLYFLFSMVRFRFKIGDNEIEVEEQVSVTAINKLDQMKKEQLEITRQIQQQNRCINDFVKDSLNCTESFLDLLLMFLKYLRGFYIYHPKGLAVTAFFTDRQKVYGLNFAGFPSPVHPKLPFFLNKVIETKSVLIKESLNSSYTNDENSPELSEIPQTSIAQIIGIPMLHPSTGEVWGIVIGYSEYDNLTFTVLDYEILHTFCQIFQGRIQMVSKDFQQRYEKIDTLSEAIHSFWLDTVS